MVDTHIGRRLRDRRRTLGLSQAQLATRMGFTPPQINRYEHGTTRLTVVRGGSTVGLTGAAGSLLSLIPVGGAARGVVTEGVYLGTSTSYNVTTSTGAEVTVFDQNASSAEDLAVRGDHVFLSWNPQHSYPIGA